MVDDKVHCMLKAKEYESDYWDGDRRYGYGGYKYLAGRWKPVAQALIDRFRASGDIGNDGIALVLSQRKTGELDLALSNLQSFSSAAKKPASVYFLESEIWAQKSEWQKAWEAMVKYQNAIHK